MREIKFRAKSITGEWVYGNFIHSKRFEGCSNEFRIHDKETSLESDIIIETLGEFTGLQDKNGVDIYEGDIYNHNGKLFACVFVSVAGFVFIEINKNLGSVLNDRILIKNHNYRTLFDLYAFCKYTKIIGNIHQNPELLR